MAIEASCQDQSGGRAPLTVIGVHRDSDAYPNTRYALEALRSRFRVREFARSAVTWEHGRPGTVRRLFIVTRLLGAHVTVMARYLVSPRADVAYVPYPSIGILLLFSFLPVRLRPRRIVADAFISLFDTVVTDREILSTRNPLSVLLHTMERRAYVTADQVVVDTPQNAQHYAALFRLPLNRFPVVPLSTNERDFVLRPYEPGAAPIRVLFVGTLVPLHGMATIVQAARRLSSVRHIEFRIIGDGQDRAALVAGIAEGLPNLTWVREWYDADDLAQEVAAADICLGIFGEGAKAQRVCPYKLYAYMAVGRPVVTADTEWTKDANRKLQAPAFATVASGDGEALALRIARLADDPEARLLLAGRSRAFYDAFLRNDGAAASLAALLRPTRAQASG